MLASHNLPIANIRITFNPLNAELSPICHLLALLGGATIVDVSRLRVKIFSYCLHKTFYNQEAFLLTTKGTTIIAATSTITIAATNITKFRLLEPYNP
jgi:hypothetical protein